LVPKTSPNSAVPPGHFSLTGGDAYSPNPERHHCLYDAGNTGYLGDLEAHAYYWLFF
jgi:hypothetical protein